MDSKTHVSQKVLRFLLKRTGGNYEAATEVVQETYLAAMKSYHTFQRKSSYFTWLCKIALNKLADYYRDQVRHESHVIVPAVEKFEQMFDPGLTPVEKIALDELKAQVNKCLDLLPTRYRQLLQLRYYEQLSLKEMSLRLHLSTRSLEGKLYRARQLLKSYFISS